MLDAQGITKPYLANSPELDDIASAVPRHSEHCMFYAKALSKRTTTLEQYPDHLHPNPTTMASEVREPEVYWTKPNEHCPNSKLPVLVYRNVLPDDLNEASVRSAFEKNEWQHGGTFKHYPTAHFHSNVHECYAAIR